MKSKKEYRLSLDVTAYFRFPVEKVTHDGVGELVLEEIGTPSSEWKIIDVNPYCDGSGYEVTVKVDFVCTMGTYDPEDADVIQRQLDDMYPEATKIDWDIWDIDEKL